MTVKEDRPITRIEREPAYWQGRNERTCKGCGGRFVPHARAALYCRRCSAKGLGRPRDKSTRPTLAEVDPRPASGVRRDTWPWNENVVVERKGSWYRYKPLGDCTADELDRRADQLLGAQWPDMQRARWFRRLALAVRSCNVLVAGELRPGEEPWCSGFGARERRAA